MTRDDYDEERMLALIGFYEELLTGLKEWVAAGGTLRSIPDTENAPVLFKLHQIALALVEESGVEVKYDQTRVADDLASANAVLKAAGITLEMSQGEFVALAGVMRTHAFIHLAPYCPQASNRTRDKIW